MGLCPACLLDDIAEPVVGAHGVQRCPTIKQLNEEIKGFQIVELLGKGGAAWTFLAVQESLSREVAVKVMYRNSNWKDSSARFQREAESLAKLNHPRIVTIHDFGSTEDFHYLIMEFVPGPTLRRRINTLRPNVQQSLNIASQICEAVQYAHDAGILHRDIKPENILFTSEARDAQVKVADFGIAQIFASGEFEALTHTGLVSGTPYYIAPEQNCGLNLASPRSDVFAIGVVLYELLCGRLPIGNFPRPSEFCYCNRNVDAAVLKALQNRPEKRTADPRSLASQLNQSFSWLRWTAVTSACLMVLSVVAWLVFFSNPNSTSDPTVPGIPTTNQVEPSEAPLSDSPQHDRSPNQPSTSKPAPPETTPEQRNPFLRQWKPEELQ